MYFKRGVAEAFAISQPGTHLHDLGRCFTLRLPLEFTRACKLPRLGVRDLERMDRSLVRTSYSTEFPRKCWEFCPAILSLRMEK